MTGHYYEHNLVSLHYYKFGNGPKAMLCFHGYGMHGKQFKLLESALGSKYTFYGPDLFFHNETKLKDESLINVKKGITKKELSAFIADFCKHEAIERFSVIGYSMGTHYAATIVEELGFLVDEFIVAAPSCLNPGKLIRFFSKNKAGNKILEKIALNGKALANMLKVFNHLRFLSDAEYKILYNEIGTAALRYNFYACFTYLRFLETDEERLLTELETHGINCIFIFGKRDKSFPPRMGGKFIPRLKRAEVVVLNEGHEMIKKEFAAELTRLLL